MRTFIPHIRCKRNDETRIDSKILSMFIFSRINKGGEHCKETSNCKVAKVWPENGLKWLVPYSRLTKSIANGIEILGSLKAQPEMTISSVQIVYLGMWFRGARREDIGNETEKKAMPVQRCIIELSSPLGSHYSILLELLRSLMKYASELNTQGTKPGGISHWLPSTMC